MEYIKKAGCAALKIVRLADTAQQERTKGVVCVVLYYLICFSLYCLFGHLFLPDAICATTLYKFGGLVFPFVFLFVLDLILKLTGYEPPKAEKKSEERESKETPEIDARRTNWTDSKHQTIQADTQITMRFHDDQEYSDWSGGAMQFETLVQPPPAIRKQMPDDVLADVDQMDGTEFEKWCALLLGALGYSDVKTTPHSGDQGVDITAVKDNVRYAFQCKCYSSDLGNHPVQEVYAGKTLYKCHVGVVMTNRHFTQGAKELAEATGVFLWDRDELKKRIRKVLRRDEYLFMRGGGSRWQGRSGNDPPRQRRKM